MGIAGSSNSNASAKEGKDMPPFSQLLQLETHELDENYPDGYSMRRFKAQVLNQGQGGPPRRLPKFVAFDAKKNE